MTLVEQLTADMKEAMKAKDKVRLTLVRGLRSSVQNKAIDLGRDMTDEDVLAVIKSEVKKRKDAIELYKQGGREDLAEQENAEKELLEGYLPAQLSDDEIYAIIDDVIAQNPEAQFGALMGQVVAKVSGQADGSRVSALLKSRLEK
jgi:uncharacterized protein YqeY